MRRAHFVWPVTAVCIGTIGSAALATETITYTYDARGRLVQTVRSGTVNNGQQSNYTLDPADNRTNVTTTGAPN